MHWTVPLFVLAGLMSPAQWVEHAVPSPEPQEVVQSAAPVGWGKWEPILQCESNGDWQANTGNGFYGGLQFTLRSWQWVGGKGYPHEAAPQEQIHRAEKLLALQGWRAWPACSRKVGYR